MESGTVAEFDVVATLDAVDACHAARAEADAALFELAAHFADLHAGEGLPREGAAGCRAGNGRCGSVGRRRRAVIARIDASVGLFAEALAALGDSDDLDQRRVKAMVVLCNPTKAVELLATFAAARSRTSATQLFDPADEASSHRWTSPRMPRRRPQTVRRQCRMPWIGWRRSPARSGSRRLICPPG